MWLGREARAEKGMWGLTMADSSDCRTEAEGSRGEGLVGSIERAVMARFML